MDSADAAADDRHDAFCYLVDAARESGMGVVAVSDLDSRELVHDTLARRFGAGVAEHPVPLLSDAELDELVETFAELARFTFNSESRELLRQLRLVDRLVRGRVAGIPLTEADLVQDVRPGRGRRNELSDTGSPHERELELLRLARREKIDNEHAAALREVALTQHAPTSHEDSTGDSPPEIVPTGCELRFALIAPWLVAPHPNSEGSIDSVEGVRAARTGQVPGSQEPLRPQRGRARSSGS